MRWSRDWHFPFCTMSSAHTLSEEINDKINDKEVVVMTIDWDIQPSGGDFPSRPVPRSSARSRLRRRLPSRRRGTLAVRLPDGGDGFWDRPSHQQPVTRGARNQTGRATRVTGYRGLTMISRRGTRVAAIVAIGTTVVLGINGIASAIRPDDSGGVLHRATSSASSSGSSPSPRLRPAAAPFEHLTRDWAANLTADPVAMKVSDADTIVVTPVAVVAYDTASGSVRWTAPLDKAEPYVSVNAKTVLVGTLDGFAALDRATGKPRWRIPIDAPTDRARGVALVNTAAGVVAVAATELGGVVGLDTTTGATLWSLSVDGSPRGNLVSSTDRTGAVALVSDRSDHADLRVFDATTGAVRWSDTLPARTGTPAIAGGLLMVGSGVFDAAGTVRGYQLVDGHLQWETPTPAYFKVDPAPVAADGTVYLVDGVGTAMALDLATGVPRWTHTLTGVAFLLDLAVMDGSVFVTDLLVRVHVLYSTTGRPRSRWDWAGFPVQIGTTSAGRIVIAQGQVRRHQVLSYVPHHMTDVERPEHPKQLKAWLERQAARDRAAERCRRQASDCPG